MAGKKKAVRTAGYIDPIYKKYMNRVVKTLKSDEFYQYFMESLNQGSRSYQFSNRKLEKQIDEEWVAAIEKCMTPFQNIIMNPRNFITEDEEIVNVAVARQSTPEVLRHLTTHGKYIDEITEDNVRPNHLLNKFKEDSWNTYENRFVYTLLEKTTEFVSKRFEAIFANMGEEFGAFLKVEASAKNETDTVSANLDIRIRQNEDYLNDNHDSMDLFRRIAKLNEQLRIFGTSQFAKEMRKYARVKNPIVKTNAIQKNPNFKACYVLWVFIYNYHDVGYEINIYEQSNEITPEFEEDIYNSIFVNYLILKNYLDQESDRLIDTHRRFQKRKLKPRFIKKIVEEIVGNYDITDTEIRKILIEEFTKAQLEQIEAKERRQIVEEQERRLAEKRKKEAEEKRKLQQKIQMERAKRIRMQEKEKEKKRKAMEKRREDMENLVATCLEELKKFEQEKETVLQKREKLRDETKKTPKTPRKITKRKPKPKVVPESVVEEPIVAEPIVEEPVTEVVSEAVETPVAEVVSEAAETPAIELMPEVVEEPVAEESASEESAAEEPSPEEPEQEEAAPTGITGALRTVLRKIRGE